MIHTLYSKMYKWFFKYTVHAPKDDGMILHLTLDNNRWPVWLHTNISKLLEILSTFICHDNTISMQSSMQIDNKIEISNDKVGA